MTVQNSLTKKKPAFSTVINSEAYTKLINSTLKDKDRANRFVTAITTAVANNAQLKECDPASIISSALLGETLNLSPSPQLGYYYLVPFNDRTKGKIAQFIVGYKGLIQLAIRTGKYKKINVMAIKKGELEYFDPLNEEIKVNLMIEDWDKREQAETIGYYAMFELVNGYKKCIYWSKEQMETHALNYSAGYKAKKGYTFWEKNFDGMAYKTMLRQLLSKWGAMSTEMENAVSEDMKNEEQIEVFQQEDDKTVDDFFNENTEIVEVEDNEQ